MPIKINGATSGSLTIKAPDAGSDQELELVGALSSKAPVSAGVPSGAVMHFAMATAPTGWLKADGSTVSRTTYAALFAAIGTLYGAGDGSTTFKLPDLRGEFVRGFDDGRGVDSGRAIGSAQGQMLETHQHALQVDGGGSANARLVWSSDGNGAINQNTDKMIENPVGATVGSETRPRNVALLACIKI